VNCKVMFFAAAFAAISPGTAFAASCTQHFQACQRNEGAMGKPAARCDAPLKRCLAACKAGKPGVFVGPSSGRGFPASECN
jgi:hypothetical protein